MNQVINIAKAHFADPHLGHHVSFILEGRHIIQEHPAVPVSRSLSGGWESKLSHDVTMPSAPVSEELFDLLLEVKKTENPIQVESRPLHALTLSLVHRFCFSGHVV